MGSKCWIITFLHNKYFLDAEHPSIQFRLSVPGYKCLSVSDPRFVTLTQGVYKKENLLEIFLFSLYCGSCRVYPPIPLFNLPLSVIGVKITKSEFGYILSFGVSERSNSLTIFII